MNLIVLVLGTCPIHRQEAAAKLAQQFCNAHNFKLTIEKIVHESTLGVDELASSLENALWLQDPNHALFFIIDNAQTMTLQASNQLLKILEEPPVGINFILLANQENDLLPTITSRCHHIASISDCACQHNWHEVVDKLVGIFGNAITNPASALIDLDDTLETHQAVIEKNHHLIYETFSTKIGIFNHPLEKYTPPPSGKKHFWRLLLLQHIAQE